MTITNAPKSRDINLLPQLGSLPPATQAFLVALGILAIMALAAAFAGIRADQSGKEFIKPVINTSVDLCKVLVGAFAGSLTGRRAVSK
jgi:hypothetical protein